VNLPTVGKIHILCLVLKANLSWGTFEGNIIIKSHIQAEDPHLGIYLTSFTALRYMKKGSRLLVLSYT